MAAPTLPPSPVRRPVGYHAAFNLPATDGFTHVYHLGTSPFDGFTVHVEDTEQHALRFELLVAGRLYSMAVTGKDAARKTLAEAEFHLFTPSDNRAFVFATTTTMEHLRKSQQLLSKQLADMTPEEKEQRKLQELATREQLGVSRTKYLPKGEFMDTEVIREIYTRHIQNILQPPGDIKIAYRTRVPADPTLDKEHTVEIARNRVYTMLGEILETRYQ